MPRAVAIQVHLQFSMSSSSTNNYNHYVYNCKIRATCSYIAIRNDTSTVYAINLYVCIQKSVLFVFTNLRCANLATVFFYNLKLLRVNLVFCYKFVVFVAISKFVYVNCDCYRVDVSFCYTECRVCYSFGVVFCLQFWVCCVFDNNQLN